MATREEEIITFEDTDSKFAASFDEAKPKALLEKKKKSKQDPNVANPDEEENEDHNIPLIHRHRFYESELPEVSLPISVDLIPN
jgi:hypothetical protein